MNSPHCDCLDQDIQREWSEKRFHGEKQDTESVGWKRLLDLVETAAADGREEFVPARGITQEAWEEDVVTLPATIAKLKSVRRFVVGRSSLVRIPPEIGEMENLEAFNTYTSHQLHWYPYEITRCQRLRATLVSTRALYGNFKYRPPFPQLQPPRSSTTGLELDGLPPEIWGADSIKTCSVCKILLARSGLYQVWISLQMGTDVLPLLVNAYSEECIRRLPQGADNYVKTPHEGRSGSETATDSVLVESLRAVRDERLMHDCVTSEWRRRGQ
jgi:hypothetical protein